MKISSPIQIFIIRDKTNNIWIGEKKSWVRARNQAKIFKTLVGARNYINRLYNESNLRLLDCFSGSYVQAVYENISIEHLRATELFDTIEYPFLENQ